MNIQDFQMMKNEGTKITFVTCYDYSSARIIEETDIDCVLVGDTLAMVMHGHNNTTKASLEHMIFHTEAVARGIKTKFIIADMPFLSYRKSLAKTCEAVAKLIQAGANAIKLEGAEGNLKTIRHLVASGVPVMGHIGLQPQSIQQLGGHKIQGKNSQAAELLISQAKALEKAGCFALVIECIPWQLAKDITDALTIPTIGIGAGSYTSGQVLVLHDLLGLQKDFKPKYLKSYASGFELFKKALNDYANEVKTNIYPSINESYQ